MPDSIKPQNGQQAAHPSPEAADSLITRTLEPLRKMTTLSKTLGIVSLIALTLLCYLGKRKIAKKAPRPHSP